MLDSIIDEVRRDLRAARERDPAAVDVSSFEILTCWPGVQAVLVYRLANYLYRRHIPFLPRLASTVIRSITGVEIHHAAVIGEGLFIDHGMGVVIGETTEIGRNVTLYHGVTLGGTGFSLGKRHPTLEDNVVVGAGAKILGPLRIGAGAKIGANTVVVHDVPEGATVVGLPGRPVRIAGRVPKVPDTDWMNLPDPIADAMRGLSLRLNVLEHHSGVAAANNPASAVLDAQPDRDVEAAVDHSADAA